MIVSISKWSLNSSPNLGQAHEEDFNSRQPLPPTSLPAYFQKPCGWGCMRIFFFFFKTYIFLGAGKIYSIATSQFLPWTLREIFGVLWLSILVLVLCCLLGQTRALFILVTALQEGLLYSFLHEGSFIFFTLLLCFTSAYNSWLFLFFLAHAQFV